MTIPRLVYYEKTYVIDRTLPFLGKSLKPLTSELSSLIWIFLFSRLISFESVRGPNDENDGFRHVNSYIRNLSSCHDDFTSFAAYLQFGRTQLVA